MIRELTLLLVLQSPGGPFDNPKERTVINYVADAHRLFGLDPETALRLAAGWLGLPGWKMSDGLGPILARIP